MNKPKVPKEGFVIKLDKQQNKATVTYKSKNGSDVLSTVTIQLLEGSYQCSCDTFTLRGSCFHTNNSKTLLENALDAVPNNEVPNEN